MARRAPVRRSPGGDADNQAVIMLLPALRRAQKLPITAELRSALIDFTAEIAVILDPTTAKDVT